jgi:putative ABC transport system permease protein
LRFARRALLGQPGFTVAAIVAIAVGIGANTTVFSAIQAILLRPLPYPQADRLAAVWQVRPDGEQNHVSARNFGSWRERGHSFSEMAALSYQYFAFTGQGEAEQLIAAQVTPELFGMLRARPWIGRVLEPAETGPGAPRVAILSHELWMRRFAGRPEVVGSAMTLSGAPFVIIGVMPAGFYFLTKEINLWTPLMASETNRPDAHGLRVFARLRDGAEWRQAQAEMTAIAKALEIERPERNRGWGARVVPLHEDTVGKLRPSLLMLWGAAGLLLLIAVCNVSNLLLARASTRQPEIAIRCAMGASPGKITRQLLTESLLLGVAGGALGLALAAAASRIIAAGGGESIPRLEEVRIDGWALAFTAGVTAVAAVVFGIVPALRSSNPDLLTLLKEEGRGSSGGRDTRRWQRLLVSWQIALSVVLLSGAALLVSSFVNLQRADRGFQPEGVLTLRISMVTQYRDRVRAKAAAERMVERLAALPGVRSAALSTGMPLDGRQTLGMQYRAEGASTETGADRPVAITHLVTPGYLETLRLRLREGRWVTAGDREETAPVVVVSRSLARRHWPEGAVGQRLIVAQPAGGSKMEVPREIVGVVEDVEYPTGKSEDRIEIYFPFAQSGWPYLYLYLRTEGDPAAAATAARRAIAEVDPDVPISAVLTLEEELERVNTRRRFDSRLAALLAGLALVLTVIGVYGVISCSAAQQTREIAVRVAFGAEPRNIRSHVLRETLRMSMVGIAIGVAAYYPVMLLMGGMLYGVDAARYWMPAAAALMLALLAAAVSWIPARRTARLDPAVVLHEPPRW